MNTERRYRWETKLEAGHRKPSQNMDFNHFSHRLWLFERSAQRLGIRPMTSYSRGAKSSTQYVSINLTAKPQPQNQRARGES